MPTPMPKTMSVPKRKPMPTPKVMPTPMPMRAEACPQAFPGGLSGGASGGLHGAQPFDGPRRGAGGVHGHVAAGVLVEYRVRVVGAVGGRPGPDVEEFAEVARRVARRLDGRPERLVDFRSGERSANMKL